MRTLMLVPRILARWTLGLTVVALIFLATVLYMAALKIGKFTDWITGDPFHGTPASHRV